MELAIIALVVVLAAVVYYNRSVGRRGLDVNQDGKVDVQDVVDAVKTAAEGVSADVEQVKTAIKKPRSGSKRPAAKKKTST